MGLQTGKNRNLSPKSWSSICTPKHAGGMGFRALADHNQAMLSKLISYIASNTNCLWTKMMRGKYLHQLSFWEVERHPHAS